jgi:hypothetical protein
MSSESLCQVACSWVDMGTFHMSLFGVVYLAVTTVREFLDTPSCVVSTNICDVVYGSS